MFAEELLHICDSGACGAFPPFLNPSPIKSYPIALKRMRETTPHQSVAKPLSAYTENWHHTKGSLAMMLSLLTFGRKN